MTYILLNLVAPPSSEDATSILTTPAIELPQINQEPIEEEERETEMKLKFLMTGTELAMLPTPTNRYLLEPFFPSVGTVLIAGQPDTGKSQWARQLAIQVANGAETCFGFKLTTKHQHALYVATEDDGYSCQYLLQQQEKGLGYERTGNIRFAFPEGMSLGNLLLKLDAALVSNPVDLIVIDSFSDVFNGSDANSNTQMRSVANAFDALAKKHGCLVLFVHHINKAAYDKKPSQQGIQGGSGLTQKVRCALQLSPDPAGGNKRYLSVSKGNYCPAEFKQKQFELDFDTSTFIFTNNGQQLGIGPSSQEILPQKAMNNLKTKLDWILGVKHLDAWTAIKDITQCSEATAKRKVKALKEGRFIEKNKETSLYHWKEDRSEMANVVPDTPATPDEQGTDLKIAA